jgi:hypothetical protein
MRSFLWSAMMLVCVLAVYVLAVGNGGITTIAAPKALASGDLHVYCLPGGYGICIACDDTECFPCPGCGKEKVGRGDHDDQAAVACRAGTIEVEDSVGRTETSTLRVIPYSESNNHFGAKESVRSDVFALRSS